MELIKNNNRFSFIENEETVGYVEFEIHDDELSVLHTVVNEKFQGRGIARSLMKEIEIYAKSHELKIIPICSYAAKYFLK